MVRLFGDSVHGGFATGMRLTLWVSRLPPTDPDCRTHYLGRFPAYVSNCRDWSQVAHELYIFHVELENRSDRTQRFRLRDFFLVDRKGNRHSPLRLHDEAEDPSGWISPRGRIRSNSSVDGHLAFDASHRFRPERMVYVDDDQTLVLRFPAQHRTEPPG